MSFWCKVLGHRWEACRCIRCGAERDRNHRFEPMEGKCVQKCTVCEKEQPLSCQWHHCACSRCGNVRDEDHDWMYTTECEQICRICGKEQAEHRYKPVDRGVDRCLNCGKTHKLTAEEISRRDEEWSNEFE